METTTLNIPHKKSRVFLPNDLVIDSWDKLFPFFEDLKNRNISSVEDLEKWLKDWSELDAVLEEDMAWRYIKMSINTSDEQLVKDFEFFVTEIEPKTAPYFNQYNIKLIENKFSSQLNPDKYFVFLRGVKKSIEIFREENIPLQTDLQKMAQQYGMIAAKMMVEWEGEKLTIQQASKHLKSTDRAIREQAYFKIWKERIQYAKELDELYTKLIEKRHQVALNAGFKSYKDYMFAALGRFDYTPQDCVNFHEAIEKEIVPLVKQLNQQRKEKLGLETLKPWDLEVDTSGKEPLKPFDTTDELVVKTIDCFNQLDPYFGECIATLKKMNYLDLDSKPGKAPGGFNYPLHEIGVPFIYMNAVGSHRDLVTMVHEGGHAIHSFLTKNLELTAFKNVPSEGAELASMGMELLSMKHWDIFYENADDLKRAKREQLEGVLSALVSVARIDAFQHWVYDNPTHTVEQRHAKWREILNRFGTGMIDHSDFDEVNDFSWQPVLHLFEVPFYYIEYGIAQLGAIALWRNFSSNTDKTIENYKEALKLGYTKPLPVIYKTAGIQFNFSRKYVSELSGFVENELKKV
ncbi:MAG: M3 family oligoendopeptidase [Vicingaceae bacterium]